VFAQTAAAGGLPRLAARASEETGASGQPRCGGLSSRTSSRTSTCTRGSMSPPWQCRPATLVASKVEVQAERWGAEQQLPMDLVQAFCRWWHQIGEEEIAELAELARVP